MTEQTEPTEDPISLLADIEANLSEFWPSQRANMFRRAAELFTQMGDDKEAQRATWLSYVWDFHALHRGERENHKGRFAPLLETKSGVYPHLSQLPQEALAYVVEQLEATRNPIHRARYGDFLWEVTQKPRDFRAGLAAVEGYLEAVSLYLYAGGEHEYGDALDRALELAAMLRNRELLERTKQVGFDIADQLITEHTQSGVRWGLDALKALQRIRDLPAADRERIYILAREGARFYHSVGDYFGERAFLELLPTEEGGPMIGASWEGQGDAADSQIGAMAFYRHALEAYASAGVSNKMEEVKRKLVQATRKSDAEMKSIRAELELPYDKVIEFANYFERLPLEEALICICMDDSLIPDYENTRRQAAEILREQELHALFSRVSTDAQGHIVGTAATEEEHLEEDVLDHYIRGRFLYELFLFATWDRLEENSGLDANSLMNFLRKGDLFEESTLDFVQTGVDRYFTGDYVSAIHVLVPHLENAIRRALRKIGMQTISYRGGETREKQLDDVLKQAELRAGFGENFVRYMEILLIDRRADNLRHRTAHGLLRMQDCSKEAVRRVLYCYFAMVKFTVVQKEREDATSTEEESAGSSE